MLGAEEPVINTSQQIVASAVLFLATAAAIRLGAKPLGALILRREQQYARVLGGSLLLTIKPRSVTILTLAAMACLALLAYGMTFSVAAALLGMLVGVLLPTALIRCLRTRRLNRLELQLVGGIQTLASGVRAGLNLVQAMELIARDGPVPLRQEFVHMLREYEYGLTMEEAMNNAAARIGSGDFRLLFSALLTHRQRGGDLGDTLDRIADSLREIQRLESRVQTFTAQGRATARALGAMPAIVLAILYFLVDKKGVVDMFTYTSGKLLLAMMLLLNIMGFLWVRKIMDIDV